MNTNQSTIVRSFWQAIAVPEAEPLCNTVHLKIFYPGDNYGTQNFLAIVPPTSNLAPFPVVIFSNGFNCSLAVY